MQRNIPSGTPFIAHRLICPTCGSDMKMKILKGRNGVEGLKYWCVNPDNGCSFQIETNTMLSTYIGPKSIRPEEVKED